MDFKKIFSRKEKAADTSIISNVQDGIIYEVVKESKTKYVAIKGCDETIKELILPDRIAGCPVEVIKKGAFSGNNTLVSVKMTDKIRVLGSEAFRNCKNLEKAELPPDLKVINASCFEGCSSLKEIIIPYSLQKISSNAFKGCSELKTMIHYVKSGIGAIMKLDKSIIEDKLPSGLNFIGESAFEGCKSIEQIYIPYGIKTIKANTFNDCEKLRDIRLHNSIECFEKKAFAGCNALKKVRFPQHVETIGEKAFPKDTEFICSQQSVEILTEAGYGKITPVVKESTKCDSSMQPGEGEIPCFYNEEELANAVNFYETRTPVDVINKNERKQFDVKSRFTLKDGVYFNSNEKREGIAKILMTGDLMCRPKQIKAGEDKNGNYNYDKCFENVKDILGTADLVIGNMESMISPSYAYCSDQSFVDDRVHLNAPDEFVASIKNAGYDLVVNAQNHAYDTGIRGVYETLDAMNRAQLIHTGLYAGMYEKRYVVLEVNGIRCAVIAYFDQARQAMKRVNFTDEALKDVFGTFEEEQVKKDIADAKAEGAEFIIAYCHCGREYTDKISSRQEKFVKMVANAGADYIFGCHSHCIQPYSVIRTHDKRRVPVLYSGGNFLSDISINPPYTRDSLILELELCKNSEGNVEINKEGYHPCLIRNESRNFRISDMRVFPINNLLKKCTLNERLTLEESLFRIKNTVGNNARFKCLVDKDDILEKYIVADSKSVEEYCVQSVTIAKKGEEENVNHNQYIYDENDQIFRRKNDEALKEARIICAGQIGYDKILERDAESFGEFEFSKSFKTVSNCFENVDFVIGNLNATVSPSYPTIAVTNKDICKANGYCNARIDYIKALQRAGFDGIAASNYHSASLGMTGVLETEKCIQDSNMISSGVGIHKNPIVEINGINVAFLSVSADYINASNMITDESIDIYLNRFDETRTKKTIDELKQRGAEFVLVYLNCGTEDERHFLKKRKELAEKIAEMGADYVICTVPKIISGYYRHTTEDGRCVPIVSSLGSFISGKSEEEDFIGALVKLYVRKDFDGKVEVEDDYIPLKIFKEFKGIQHSVMPAMSFFNKSYKVSDYAKVKTTLKEKFGEEFKVNEERIVKMNSKYTASLTIAEIYEILGKKPSEKDMKKFGKKYHQPVSLITNRRPSLQKDSVAVLYDFKSFYLADEVRCDVASCLKAGVSLVIDNVNHSEIPTIVVEGSLMAVYQLLVKKIRDKYNPVTLAITGSMGKTTTKELIKNVFKSHYKTLDISGNYNTVHTIGQVIQKLDSTDEAYIQEVHGGSIGAASSASEIIKPNICVITNIEKNHIEQVGSLENLIKCKLQLVDGMQENGVLIINNDNENLRKQNPTVRTIRYSTYDSSCHYYARNIVNTGTATYFEIVSNESEFDEAGVYNAKLNIQGVHNVGNALAAFASGRQAGVPPYKIIAAMSRYKTEGFRQNVTEVNGIKMILDANNSNPVALMAMMKVFDTLKPAEGGRKIAVLGMMGEQGAKSKEIHYETGKALCQHDFDLMLCTGNDAIEMVKAVREEGREAYFFEERRLFNKAVADNIKAGDVAIFKASASVKFEDDTIVPVFGDL